MLSSGCAQHNTLRSVDAWTLRRELGRQKGECTWCGGPVKKPRLYWCSQACVDAHQVRTPAVARLVHKRDNGICATCGVDTDRMSRLSRLIRSGVYHKGRQVGGDYHSYKALWDHWQRLGFDRGPLWQADHILPVCEGGGLCGLSGFRTLCTVCHKAETKALAKRRRKVKT